MSTSHGPWKFETTYCGIAKATPATSTAGQTSIIPRSPRTPRRARTGTMSEKSGSCRPTIALRSSRSSPVTPCRAMIGVPSAPKATGAVFAMSDRPDASSGAKAERDEERARDGDGRPEARRALEERAEAERDEQQLQAAIVRQAA